MPRKNPNPEREAYLKMISRCYNPKSQAYAKYGGRGIEVCKQWLESYDCFLNDMGKKPSNKHSLERIDNNGNYSPKNCKWATNLEQTNNRSITRFLTYKGETRLFSEWANSFKIKYRTLHQRLEYGWTVESALETPIRKKRDHYAK